MLWFINIHNIYEHIAWGLEFYTPKIIWAFATLSIWILISIAIYKLVLYIFKRFHIIEFIDKLNIDFTKEWKEEKRVSNAESKRKISDKIPIDKIVAKAFSYYVILVFFRLAIVVIGIQEIEDFLWELLRYLPSLFIWVVIWFFWIRFANFIHDVVYHALNLTKQKTAKIIASGAKIIILFFTLMMVLSRIGIAPEITNTILIGFVSMLSIAWWLAFWLWWKEIAREILESFRK